MPEPWVVEGGATQLRSAGHDGVVDVVIGLDFGTSYTKAAVGFMDKIFPVSWDGVSRCSLDLLLPSEFTEMPDGSVYLGQHEQATESQVCADLKLPFINPAVSSVSILRASVFVALVLRYIRAWVYRHHGAKIGRRSIRWQLNVGAPSNGLESRRLEEAYMALAATAWQRSLCADAARVAGSSTELWTKGHTLQDLSEQPRIFPEFVAQMAGYMQSPQRQPGLHALVDVGGGTLDVVTFIVHRVEDEDAFPFLVPQIHPFGTHGLLQNRIAGVTGKIAMGAIDELEPIDAAPAFAAKVGVDEGHVVLRDKLFAEAISTAVSSVFALTKSRRYRLSDAWRLGVRTFFTGGGSQLGFYSDVVSKAEVPSAQGLLLSPLPIHPRIDGFSGGSVEYQRISVACGLAQDSFSLGRIVPASEVADDSVPIAQAAIRLDRDELYAK